MTLTNTQRALGELWCNCNHYDCDSDTRGLLNDWVINEYLKHIVGKYTVEFVDRDPYAGDAELRCQVSNSGHIKVFQWSQSDTAKHFLSPLIGMYYQAMHDVVHHVEQDNDFGAEGERQSMLQMKQSLIEFAKDNGYDFECIRKAVGALVSHTYLRVLGILYLLERDGDLSNYEHRILNLHADQ